MNPIRRFLALTPGNPMNPVTLLVLGFFAIVLIGFPVLMAALDMPTRDIVLVMVVVVLVAVGLIAFMVSMGRRYARDFERLVGGEHWVHWTVTPDEHQRFVTSERTRSRKDARLYVLFSLVVAVIGAGVMWRYTGTSEGAAIGFGVLTAIGALVVVTTWFWGGARPRHEATDIGDIYLGDLGIYHLGRYTPVQGFNLFLTAADYLAEDPPALRFAIGSRTQHGYVRTNEVRVMVPSGRETEAEEIAARYQRQFNLAGP